MLAAQKDGRRGAAERTAENDYVVVSGHGPIIRYHAPRMQGTLHHLVAVWMQFVLDWGYLGIFLMMVFESTAVPIPAEVVIPPAAYWAAQGRFNIWLVVIAATIGSWVGSAISYWVSYKLGRPLVARFGKYVLLSPAKVERA